MFVCVTIDTLSLIFRWVWWEIFINLAPAYSNDDDYDGEKIKNVLRFCVYLKNNLTTPTILRVRLLFCGNSTRWLWNMCEIATDLDERQSVCVSLRMEKSVIRGNYTRTLKQCKSDKNNFWNDAKGGKKEN
jgi:hypothetical protein